MQTKSKKEKEIEKIHQSDKAFAIHYACENLSQDTTRIIYIAVRELHHDRQFKSFSIDDIAKNKNLNLKNADEHQKAEKQMLKDFVNFLEEYSKYAFVHWNMRDSKFGFQAILNRFNLLMKSNKKITPKTFDLSDSLIQIYGDRYIQDKPQGKLLELAKLNQLSINDTLTGKQEAEEAGYNNYKRIESSTLAKVRIISDIFDKTAKKELKRKSKLLVFAKEMKKHWLITHGSSFLIGIIISTASAILMWFLSRFLKFL